ncbi:hypothetical protein BDP27DRAFT_33145 [Rhodocollybia butyracea]|uniref:Uncharacterized protein n=1 Tax=Rhodocollybia butyracea TaxID=206335 RepID=A0A9P5UEB5_9AGAR|nr:hypothetical protein BDP27DRAFT_33145 [Rhodocollybia butyracea]
MRSVLLFALIASWVLAVCSIPVPVKPELGRLTRSSSTKKRPHSPGKSAQKLSKRPAIKILVTMTFIDGKAEVHEPDPGTIHVVPDAVPNALKEAAGYDQNAVTLDMKYHGTYEPLDVDEKWVYFTLEGLFGEPCFGYMAYGEEWVLNKDDTEAIIPEESESGEPGKFGKMYIGISKGRPAHGTFVIFKGEPEEKTGPMSVISTKTRAQSQRLSHQFKTDFKGPDHDSHSVSQSSSPTTGHSDITGGTIPLSSGRPGMGIATERDPRVPNPLPHPNPNPPHPIPLPHTTPLPYPILNPLPHTIPLYTIPLHPILLPRTIPLPHTIPYPIPLPLSCGRTRTKELARKKDPLITRPIPDPNPLPLSCGLRKNQLATQKDPPRPLITRPRMTYPIPHPNPLPLSCEPRRNA